MVDVQQVHLRRDDLGVRLRRDAPLLLQAVILKVISSDPLVRSAVFFEHLAEFLREVASAVFRPNLRSPHFVAIRAFRMGFDRGAMGRPDRLHVESGGRSKGSARPHLRPPSPGHYAVSQECSVAGGFDQQDFQTVDHRSVHVLRWYQASQRNWVISFSTHDSQSVRIISNRIGKV